jgi:hypothetical protein
MTADALSSQSDEMKKQLDILARSAFETALAVQTRHDQAAATDE